MVKPKRFFCTFAVFLLFYSAGLAQQQPPNQSSSFLDKHLPNSYVALAAEGTLTTYGVGISFPVYWIEDRVKMTPLFGFMWQNVVDEGLDARPAAGAKLVYYFQKKPFGSAPMNSFYAGLGGMGTMSYFLGRSTDENSRGGAFFGYNFFLNQTVRLAPELFLGANATGSFRAEIGFVLYFGR